MKFTLIFLFLLAFASAYSINNEPEYIEVSSPTNTESASPNTNIRTLPLDPDAPKQSQ